MTLADVLNSRLAAGTLSNLADLGYEYEADRLGRVTIVTDGIEAARVVSAQDGIGVLRCEPCPVPGWALRL